MNQNTVTGGKSLAQKGLNPSSTTSTNPQGGANPGGGGTSPTPPTPPAPPPTVGSISAPSSSVDGSIVLFNGTSGHSIKQDTDSGVVVSISGVATTIAESDGTVVYGSGGVWGKTSSPSLTAISISGAATIGSISSTSAAITSYTGSTISISGALTSSNFTGTHSGASSNSNTGDQDLSGLVPYTGATTNVNLGAHSLTSQSAVLTSISVSGAATIGSSSGIAKLTSGGVSAITLTGATTQYLNGSGAFSAPAGTTRASLGLDVTDTPAFLGIKNVQSLTTDLVIPTGYNAILVGTINSNGHMITGQGTALLRIL